MVEVLVRFHSPVLRLTQTRSQERSPEAAHGVGVPAAQLAGFKLMRGSAEKASPVGHLAVTVAESCAKIRLVGTGQGWW